MFMEIFSLLFTIYDKHNGFHTISHIISAPSVVTSQWCKPSIYKLFMIIDVCEIFSQ